MTTTHAARARLLGAWRLVSWKAFDAAGDAFHPLGADAVGQLLYDDSGRMSAQLARANRPPFADEDWLKAHPDEVVAAWPDYFGYFGTFTVDGDAGTVTHHIESGSFPNLTGTDPVRTYHFDTARDLTLAADSVWGAVRIVWTRG
ncbi:lipocalin-like domain-containing protein [Streptomyces sp. HNM0575]|uniref:lipocalin-like domain-containing protein n=1 Tax=Streptomyces sp. HNM0575 TaxID=2716338 RepID=UPI00145DCF74|nr:lipocalin-like domain-containing protein [Streptomyces sp. HNM0575]NLU72292.1 lipocalin-like domain-containing protein [Streptomyces sp. HNM0575]